jgi:thiol:disulfide interchange protein DsbC
MNIHPTLVLAALLAVPLAAVPADEPELERVRAKVVETFDGIDAEDVQASPIPGWYTIRKGTVVAYMSADGRYLLEGELFDIERKVNLTEEMRNRARVSMLADVTDEQAIVFAPDDVKHTVTVFTDVFCTYCRRFHSQIDQYLAEGIEVRYLLYPRDGPGSQGWRVAERVWCAADRNQALTRAKLDREFESDQCDASIVAEHYALGQEIGLRGTPALVLEDGTLISGYLPPAELEQRMAEMTAD